MADFTTAESPLEFIELLWLEAAWHRLMACDA